MEAAGTVAGEQRRATSAADRQNGQTEEPGPNGKRGARFWRTLPAWVRWSRVSIRPRGEIPPGILPLLELLVILVWTLTVTRPYPNLDPAVVPTGREYLHHISAEHLWTNLQECGACAFWSGSIRGGYPAFADLQESMLHPLVALATLAFGVGNGSKLAMVGAFFYALRTSDLQWVNPPFGERLWIEPAVSRGQKLALGCIGGLLFFYRVLRGSRA